MCVFDFVAFGGLENEILQNEFDYVSRNIQCVVASSGPPSVLCVCLRRDGYKGDKETQTRRKIKNHSLSSLELSFKLGVVTFNSESLGRNTKWVLSIDSLSPKGKLMKQTAFVMM